MSAYFDEAYYLQSKLTQLTGTTDAEGKPWNVDSLKTAISNAGMTTYTHYVTYGETEGVGPNALFNPAQYARAVAESWNAENFNGFSHWGESDVLTLVRSFGQTLYDHFARIGWKSALNASNAFDISAYLEDKAAQSGLSVPDVVAAFAAAGVDPITHYVLWGHTEDIPVTVVSGDEAVRMANGFNAVPTDPLFAQQWHLLNTGQNGYTPGIDLNVLPVWNNYTGEGVSVCLVDSGVEFDHPDLARNSNPSRSFGDNGGDGQPEVDNWIDENGESQEGDNHGMACAGLIAAESDNDTGGTGVAFDAELASARLGDTLDAFETALAKGFDVLSCSWGFWDAGQAQKVKTVAEYTERFGPAAQAMDAGRDGKGQIVCFASGNANMQGHDSTQEFYMSLPETIAVGATGPSGEVASYSSQFAGVLVSAPSMTDIFDAQGNRSAWGDVVSTDRQGEQGYNTKPSPEGDDCYDFNGTSASAPMVAGVVALMLEANPNLGWRDVQTILAVTARNTDPTDVLWVENAADDWNGGGLSHHRQAGFGLVDARAAVRLAETWTEQNTSANQAVASASTTVEGFIPNGPNHALTSSVMVNEQIDVENVVVHVQLDHGYAPDLELRLTSPSGTTLTIFDEELTLNSLPEPDEDGSYDFVAQNMNLGGLTSMKATGFRGEDSQGQWTLEVWDTQVNRQVGTLHNWTLEMYGAASTNDDTYIYTDGFARLAGSDPARHLLHDNLGVNTLNLAALSTGVYVNMNFGGDMWLQGQNVLFGADTLLSRAFTGDGDDIVILNGLDNTVSTGRGNDTIYMSGGNNVVNGGGGWNTAVFAGTRAQYVISGQGASFVVADAYGTSNLEQVQQLVFADQIVAVDFTTMFA